MRIERLDLHNFGVYFGNTQLDLSTDKRKPIVLLCGLNGRGKTTILDAIKLVLYGKFARCSNRGTTAYEEFLSSCINRRVRQSEGASIGIRLTLTNERASELYVKRFWRSSGTRVQEQLEVFTNGTPDPALADQWDRFIHEVLPVEVSQLFFFDGEQVEQTAEPKNAQETIRLGVKALLGVDLVDQLDKDLSYLVRTRAKDISRGRSKDRIQQLEADLSDIEARMAKLLEEFTQVHSQRDQALKRQSVLRKRYSDLGGDLLNRRDQLVDQKQGLDRERNDVEAQLRLEVAGILPLSLVAPQIRRLQDQAKRLKNHRHESVIAEAIASRDKDFLALLEEQNLPEHLILDIDSHLRSSRKPVMSADELALVPAMGDLEAFPLDQLERSATFTGQLLGKHRKIGSELGQLEAQLADVPDESEVHQLASNMNEVDADVARLDLLLSSLKREEEALKRTHLETKTRLERISSEMAVQAMRERQQQTAFQRVPTIQSVLETFKMQAVEDALGSLEARITEAFRQLTGKVNLVQRVHINPQSYALEIYDHDGKQFEASRLSAGERQLLATSILWGLAKTSGLPMPLIIDTPLGRLDGIHRNLLIRNYLPIAAHQVVVLSTDEEIDDDRYKVLKPYIKRSYSLVYDDESCSTTLCRGYGRWLNEDSKEEATG